ncbi:hypothetical protein NHX12_031793 [Muraenolepis orangiensis]|uniref:Uncharacterized protein n=1 Tax=Muraenolepis orangiensis TaxID=630683 RepID=A0A9Q0E6J9_9TELE|nr:hypothetical protein NHX12_031793 [Muraenolepis orangiensis]
MRGVTESGGERTERKRWDEKPRKLRGETRGEEWRRRDEEKRREGWDRTGGEGNESKIDDEAQVEGEREIGWN